MRLKHFVIKVSVLKMINKLNKKFKYEELRKLLDILLLLRER